MEIIQYAFPILYARKYDLMWQVYLQELNNIYQKAKKRSFRSSPKHLPIELSIIIMSYMRARALLVSSTVCQCWNTLANQDCFWDELCRSEFGVTVNSIKYIDLTESPNRAKLLYQKNLEAFLNTKKSFRLTIATPLSLNISLSCN